MIDYYDAPHTVYLHRDADGKVIYVGCTVQIKKRTATHRHRARWRHRIASIEVDSVQPSFIAGRDRERDLIRQYEPEFNTSANPAVFREREAWHALASRYGVIEAMRILESRTA